MIRNDWLTLLSSIQFILRKILSMAEKTLLFFRKVGIFLFRSRRLRKTLKRLLHSGFLLIIHLPNVWDTYILGFIIDIAAVIL